MKRSLNSLIENTDVREFKVVDVETKKISESKSQARTYFDPNKLEELSESIKKSGVLQPIIVQHTGNESYQLIAGERRLRASKSAGLKTIPSKALLKAKVALFNFSKQSLISLGWFFFNNNLFLSFY